MVSMLYNYDMVNSKSTSLLWIECLVAAHKSLLRKFAATENLQLVHIEILQYLSICNKYSDTTQSLSEYLGQTKGSISQSLKYLEETKLVDRSQDTSDKRIYHLYLTATGQTIVKKLAELISFRIQEKSNSELRNLLDSLQKKTNHRSFGICKTCKYNKNQTKSGSTCGLTSEELTHSDSEKICREYSS